MMKRPAAILFALFAASALALPATAFAYLTTGPAGAPSAAPNSSGPSSQASAPATNPQAGYTPLAPIPGLTQGVVAQSSGLVTFLQNLYKYSVGVAVILAIFMIFRGGLEIATQDSVSKKSAGRKHITQAIFGLVLVLMPVLVFSFINPAILNLSINLPPLQIHQGTTAPSGPAPCTTGNNCINAGPGSSNSTPGQLTFCGSGGCGSAQNQCINKTPGGYVANDPVVCVTPGGSIDPNGRTDSHLNPFSAQACKSGETLAVNCSYSTNSVLSK